MTREVPRPAAPVSPAEKPAGSGIRPTPTPLCRSHRHDGGRSAWRARAELVSDQESGVVYGARRPTDAGQQHAVGSGPQRHRPHAFRHERLPSSRRESSGVSHRLGAPVQSATLSAPGPACRQVWGRSGRRVRPNIGLDAQPANPHIRRLSLSGDGRHHVIRWSVVCLAPTPSSLRVRGDHEP